MSALLLAAVIAGYDWVGVSIQTSKHSESMYQRYFHSEEDCRNSRTLRGDADDRVCFPVPTLPQEVWDRQNSKDKVFLETYYNQCIDAARNSWFADVNAELKKCEPYKP